MMHATYACVGLPSARKLSLRGSGGAHAQLRIARVVLNATNSSSDLQTDSTAAASTSLIPETLEEMESDTEFQQTAARLQRLGQAAMTREEKQKRQRSLDKIGVPSFGAMVKERGGILMKRQEAAILQLNIGLYCNQACTHCHVESSPKRFEMMDRPTAEQCVRLMQDGTGSVTTVDITGGAPELNSQFKYLVESARGLGLEVIDRCNLTVLLEPGQETLAQFLADNQVHVVASMPCYSPTNVDQQRGHGVFDRSIKGLQALNAVGYGQPGTGLQLDLVYNPNGIFLAPPQSKLEGVYKEELQQHFGIVFNSLFCLNNMPIKRYVDYLQRRNKLEEYMQMLVEGFNVAAADGVMCRNTVNVGWDGRVFDCDFNQQLDMGMRKPGNTSEKDMTVFDVGSLEELTGRSIAVDNHCFGCTAGSGSSCQGAVA
ncbi:MAG: Fe-S oxidoreductase [Trebouxia sp. A1-2]|nr:MAG: Fe-S oxidoreductase [Trebouxia sp. A1-2]